MCLQNGFTGSAVGVSTPRRAFNLLFVLHLGQWLGAVRVFARSPRWLLKPPVLLWLTLEANLGSSV